MTKKKEKFPTKYPNLFYKFRRNPHDPTKMEKAYYGRYKDPFNNNKWGDAAIGREDSQGIDLDSAYQILIDLRKGNRKKQTVLKAEAKAETEQQMKKSLMGLWEQYLDGADKNGTPRKEKPIYKTDKSNFNNHLLPYFKNTPPELITDKNVGAFKATILKKGLSRQTCKHILSLLKRILKYNKVNPTLEIQMPDVPTELNNKALTDCEITLLHKQLDIDQNQEVAQIMRLILYTGMRVGEALKLKWGEIDFKGNPNLNIPPTIFLRETKSGKNVRIPMSENTTTLLKSRIRKDTIPHKSTYVFPGNSNGRRGEISKPAKRIILDTFRDDDGNVDERWLTFRPCHDLRHYFVTQLIKDGNDINTVKRLVGHADISTTQKYFDEDLSAMKQAVDNLGGKRAASD